MDNKPEEKKRGCEHVWARIWLANSNYKEGKYCRRCLEIKHVVPKKAGQENP